MKRKKKTLESTAKKRGSPSTIFVLSIILTLIGLFFIFEASSIAASRAFGDSFYYLKFQSIWFVIGVLAMAFFSYFDYHKLYYLSLPALLVTVASLVLVLIPGIGYSVAGARRWINLGIINFQPSELAKFSVILYLSSWFLYKERKRFFSFLFLLLLIIFLIMLQPNMGTAVIIFAIFATAYFISGQSLSHLLLLTPAAMVIFFLLIKTSSYRMGRILTFLNPKLDPLGISYHVKQILISLSAGGLFGRGLVESRQKYQFLPEAHTDSIFAIAAEEFGFVGSAFLIFLFFLLILESYQIVFQAKDRYGKLLAGSIFSLLAFQVMINLGGMVNLVPLTGVPLPFISYGGSSLLVFFSLMGILINIAKK